MKFGLTDEYDSDVSQDLLLTQTFTKDLYLHELSNTQRETTKIIDTELDIDFVLSWFKFLQ